MELHEIAKRAHHGLLACNHAGGVTTAAIVAQVTHEALAERRELFDPRDVADFNSRNHLPGKKPLLPPPPAAVSAAISEYFDAMPLHLRARIAINDGAPAAELEQFAQRCDNAWRDAAGVDAAYLANAARDLRQAAENAQ